MTEHEQDQIAKLLREAFPEEGAGLQRDLWPAMLRRLEPAPVRVPWYDWVLAGCSAAGVLVLPGFLMVLAYHL